MLEFCLIFAFHLSFWGERTSLVPEFYSAIILIIFWDFLRVQQIFLWPHVKQSVIISNKLIYTSYLTSSQTSKDFTWKIRKYQENLQTSYNFCLAICPLPEIKILSVVVELSWKTNWASPIVHYFTWKLECLKYFANDCR